LRVVDLTQGYVGYCGMLFADLGATVTKVEPHEGDYLRRLGPPDAGQDSAAFLAVNRSKRSVTLDWTTDAAARAKLDSLIAHADVVISDLQPSEATRHGLTYAALETGHARLVLCSLTPFGDSGPLADHPATELEIQGMSAQWRYLGEMGKEPVRHGLPMSALCGSLFAFQGILAALYERARSERGQKVEVTQLGAQITMQSIMWAAESEPDEWIGHCVRHLGEPARGYATADRSILFGFRSAEDGLREFCGRIGAPEIMDRFEPSNWNWQEEHRALFEEAFKTHSADELVAWVRELGGDAVQYHTYETLAQDPQALAIGLVSEYEYPGIGRFGTTGLAWEFSNSPAKHGRPPLLGEHNADLDA
jgi:formyl-CoA transferase